jgi:hypothetical protein
MLAAKFIILILGGGLPGSQRGWIEWKRFPDIDRSTIGNLDLKYRTPN